MKKLFAVLSVLALTFAVVGLTSVQASELFTEDPTITENDIPVYIMGSIRTTFPQYYDYNTKDDALFQGTARQYPWNETRLKVKQIADDGTLTGKEYAIYFAGSLNATDAAAGVNQLILTATDANEYGVYLSRYDAGAGTSEMTYNGTTFKYKENQGPMDGSLSHAAQNVSGKDVEMNLIDFAKATGGSGVNSWAQQMYNRAIIYDASGRAVWGNSVDSAYQGADSPAANQFDAEYCYINGVVTRTDDLTKCDRAMEAKVNELGEPELDEASEPIMVQSEEPNIIKGRFVWQWVSMEAWESTYKARTNTVSYLANGWDPEKWDDAYEKDGGMMLIAFVNAAQSKFAINDEQAQAANAALVGTEDADKYAAGYVRKYVALVNIPAGGIAYDFGYLDKGVTVCETYFTAMSVQAYKYGRQEGLARMTTYNFSAKPIYETDKVINGVSQQFLEGTQTIEILKGTKITPAANITYTGLGRYWAKENDTFSYSSDTSKLELYMTINGNVEVEPVESYESHAAMVADLCKDLATVTGKDVTIPTADQWGTTTEWYGYAWVFFTTGANSTFMSDATMKAKWSWMYTYIAQRATALGLSASGSVASPGNAMYTLLGFLLESSEHTSGWPASKYAWDATNANEWLDTRTLAEKFADVEIDTSEVAVDTNYVVDYKVVNPDTGNSSSYTITFVVVDEYTPIIRVSNASYLKYTPVLSNTGTYTYNRADGTKDLTAIDTAALVKAYNGQYNGSSIFGDDITYKVHYSSETLDFDAPTEGSHKVQVTVYNKTKFATKTLTVVVEDITAPVAAIVEKVNVAYGSTFNPYDLVEYAYDAVDGNLVGVPGAIIVKSSVDTTKAKDYTVTYTFSDNAGNYVEKTAKVTVLSNEDAKLDEIKEAVAANGTQIADLADQAEDLQAQVKALAESGCGKSSTAAVVVGFVALTGLLVVALRKRH